MNVSNTFLTAVYARYYTIKVTDYSIMFKREHGPFIEYELEIWEQFGANLHFMGVKNKV